MTKKERRELSRIIMREEEKEISPEAQRLGQLVLAEAFRPENGGRYGGSESV